MRIARVALLLLAACFVPAFAVADAPPAPQWKNLQILPKDISKDQLKAIMKAQSKALGVECDYCHNMPDAAAETKNKDIARAMIRMTKDINDQFFAKADVGVTCMTCHRGKEKPEGLMKKAPGTAPAK